MTSRFNTFMPFIFKWEGGYDNDPDDPGGETHFGIDKRSHPDVDIKALTRDGAARIYWSDYWVRNACEAKPWPLGEVFFNACVNCGAGRAGKLLAVAGDKEGANAASAFLDEQEGFYQRLADAKPRLRKYLRGWLARTADLRRTLQLAEERQLA